MKKITLTLDSLSVLDLITDEEAGRLFKAIRNFYRGDIVLVDGNVGMAFDTLKIQLNKTEKVKKPVVEMKDPTIEEIKIYFRENGYKETSATTFYNYYSVAKWFDSKGNKVKNWKQKAQAVWFKPENKCVNPLTSLKYADL